MKTLSFSIAVLFCFSTAVFAELSVSDLEKIRQIVNETEVRIEKRIEEQGKRFSAEIQAQGKRLDFHGALLITLIGAIIAFVGVPLAFITYQFNTYQFNKHSVREAEIKALREKIEALEKKHILSA